MVLSANEVSLINIRVNSNRFSTNKRTEEVAFMFLCERVNQLMRGRKSIGMLIGDRQNDRVAEMCSMRLSDYRDAGTEFAYGEKIIHLVESVHFTASHLSRFLQLADIYSWIVYFKKRYSESEGLNHKAVLDALRTSGIDLFPSKYKFWPQND